LNRFAHAVREELWLRGRLLESSLEHGEAVQDAQEIVASDVRDDRFVAACDAELERLRAFLPQDALVRLIAEMGTDGGTSVMIVRRGTASVVTSPAHIEEDGTLLRRVVDGPVAAPPQSGLPLLWLNGSAAVLLHESHGHAMEHGHAPLPLPSWLHVDVPLLPRRASFRDVPIVRMKHVRVAQHDAPFALPADHIAVHLVDGGSYEPLTETVTLRIAAATRGGAGIAPFVLSLQRHAIRFTGATGAARRYPGVICSREGQELFVESWAPDVLTELT
jgi:hypothetical protein